jgi:hypothetical protein
MEALSEIEGRDGGRKGWRGGRERERLRERESKIQRFQLENITVSFPERREEEEGRGER